MAFDLSALDRLRFSLSPRAPATRARTCARWICVAMPVPGCRDARSSRGLEAKAPSEAACRKPARLPPGTGYGVQRAARRLCADPHADPPRRSRRDGSACRCMQRL